MMGLFDSVYANCPQCGEQIEFQSKAGKCDLKSYSVNSVPPAIAEDITGDTRTCKCGYILRIVPSQPVQRVTMRIEDGSREWD